MTMNNPNQTQSAVKNDKVSSATKPTQNNNNKKNKKIFRRTLAVIGIFLGSTLAGTVGIISTESGTKWALGLVDDMVDGLSIGEVSGKLQNGLTLKDVKFVTDGVDVNVANAHLQLDFGCLLHREICIEDASIKRTYVAVNTALLPPSQEQKEESGPMKRISLPISVKVKNIAVEETQVQTDQQQLTLAKLQSAVSLNNNSGLTLAPTLIEHFRVETALSKEQFEQQQKQAAEKAQSVTPIDWNALEQTLTPALLGNLKEITLPFDMHIEDLQIKEMRYQSEVDNKITQQITIPEAQLQAHVNGYNAELKTMAITSSLGNVNGNGTMQLDGDMPLNIHLQTEIAPIKSDKDLLFPRTTADLVLSGSLKNVAALELNTKGGINANLKGQVELNKEKTPLQISLTSQALQYPFSGNDPLKVKNLNLNVTGDLLDYHASLQAQAEGMGVPKSELDFSAAGKLYQANIEKLHLQALDGKADVSGNANWKEGISWQSAVKLDKINLGAFVKDFPAVLSGNLASTGAVNHDGWSINVPELDINGSVSRHPLTLKGVFTSSRTELVNVPNLLLTYGENKITAQGILSEKSDFHLDVQAPNLRGLLPDLTASLNGKAILTGKITEPHLDLDLNGGNIQFQDLKLSKINAKGKIDSLPLIQGNLNINAEGFKYADNVELKSISLTANGDEKAHKLQLRSQGEPVAANLDLVGSFDRTSQVWNGTITQTNIKSPVGEIKNNQFSVSYDNKAVNANISAHCWNNPDIELCFPQAFNAGKSGEIPFNLKKLDLNLVNKLAENELLKGQLTSQGKFAWYTDKPIKLDLQVNGKNINYAQKIDYRTFKLAVPSLNLNAQIADNNLNAKTDIRIQDQGNINADVKITDLAKARKLDGKLKIAGLNLNVLNQLLTNKEKVSADVNANLNFAGSLNALLINGSFNINHTKAVIGAMPFDINDGELALQFHGNSSTLRGHITTPESRLDLDGNASWKDLNDWRTQIHAKAHEFYLNIPSMAKLKVSPDVKMEATPTVLDLTGEIDIPWGRIAIESLPESAVTTSSDEVILDEKTDQALLPLATKTQDGQMIRSDLQIHIGDDVTVNAYGLNSNLEGRLLVKQAKGKLGLFGGIDLKHGRYASFGQDLLIRKGKISFSGMPSNPMLNIEAIRNPEAMEDSNIIAGVKVIGIADAPEVTVFSEPSMPQDQALAYLLTGRSLENSGEAGSGGSIGAALLGMGLAKSGKAVGKIGEVFGISDLNVGTAGVGDSSKVVVSGNLTKDLQIKYGVGLFDGLAEITLRYRLLPRLFLQSISSTNQTVDLIYQFEF